MLRPGSSFESRSASIVASGLQIRVREVRRDLTLGHHVALAPLQFDDLLHPLGLVDRPPEELRHRDLVDFLPDRLKPGRQQLDLPPQLPFVGRVVPQDGERQVVVDADPGRDRLQVAFEEFNALFERGHAHTPQGCRRGSSAG